MSADLLDGLNPAQHDAVTHPEGPVLVIAGAGSGKTRVLTHRIAWLISQGVSPFEILAITFTNKAADEMKARAGVSRKCIDAGTFHGLGTRLLSQHAQVLDMDPIFIVIDDDHRDFIAMSLYDPQDCPDPLGLAERWSYRRLRNLRIDGELAEFGQRFEDAKRAERLMDYDDLVVYGSQILQRGEDVAADYGLNRHLFVDELQDVNVMHAAMIRALKPHVRTISLFGDDDQSIMSFTGSEPSDVKRLVKDLGATRYELLTNHRSDRLIIAAANRVIGRARETSARAMEPPPGTADGALEVRDWPTDREQADALADEIAGLPDPNEVAILVRNRAVADLVVEALRDRKVSVTDWRPSRLVPMARRLCQIFLEVACVPAEGAISSYAAGWLITLVGGNAMINERRPDAFLVAFAGAPVADALAEMRRTLAPPDPPLTAVVDGLRAVFAAYLLPQREDMIEWFYTRAKAALDDAPRLLEQLDDLVHDNPGLTVGNLRKHLEIVPRPSMDGGGVKVGTIQATKGLEWPTVYLLGLEQGRLPDAHVLAEDGDDLRSGSREEEHRICFVGLTRAEHRLVVGHVHHCLNPRTGIEFPSEPSEFLDQIPEREPR
jgi:DNA helicase-2/ATP-dependent DNA helicase PcrA